MIIAPENSKYKDNFIKVADKVYYCRSKWFCLETDSGKDIDVAMIISQVLKADIGGPEKLRGDYYYTFFSDASNPTKGYWWSKFSKTAGVIPCAFIAASEFRKEDAK